MAQEMAHVDEAFSYTMPPLSQLSVHLAALRSGQESTDRACSPSPELLVPPMRDDDLSSSHDAFWFALLQVLHRDPPSGSPAM